MNGIGLDYTGFKPQKSIGIVAGLKSELLKNSPYLKACRYLINFNNKYRGCSQDYPILKSEIKPGSKRKEHLQAIFNSIFERLKNFDLKNIENANKIRRLLDNMRTKYAKIDEFGFDEN